ncbi:IclR family transcriptional regulator [Virgibacillus sp. CBA3643]|uniref:IclR family transcriptional regulator n=1 Tax=Virgibacillus sp. CBA3643 TaxID=2942278 RepID=UPI0035A3AB20
MTLKSLGVALDVLSMFTKDTPEWGLRELAKEMDINHTILHRILKTFDEKNFLHQDPSTKRYELGAGVFNLLLVVQNNVSLSDLIYPIMEELSIETNESAFLTWKDGFEGVTVEISESSQQIKFAVSKGSRTPLYVGASTKVIMAYLDLEEQVKIINNGTKKITERTLLGKEEILGNLQKIKNQGWSYTEGEFSEDVFGMGVPLFNKVGKIIGSLTIAGPIYRIDNQKRKEILDNLLFKKTIINEYLQLFDVDSYR